MAVPLLSTKLFIPPPSRRLVDRSRLLSRLDECLHPGCRLALISAPAGFGKTTLVSTWAAGRMSSTRPATSIAWLSIDDGDNDPVVFWTYIISSLQTQAEGIGKHALTLLQAPQPTGQDEILPALVNDLAQVPNPFVLILDDYHLISNSTIHKWLSFFIDHAPGYFHVVITTRTDPPLRLARLRSRAQLLEVRLADLRFSNEEAESFLNKGMMLALSSNEVDSLNAKTEGWAAGLQMAALAMEGLAAQGKMDASLFIDTFSSSHRYILEYLLEEVLDRQPQDVQKFLLHTSVLDSLCGPLCDAVTSPQLDGQFMLDYLDRTNLFLIPLDGERRWYRYHNLFADLLQKRLTQVDPGQTQVLYIRASEWGEQNGLVHSAIEYAFRAGDLARAAGLIDRSAEILWRQGAHSILLDWLNRLTAKQLDSYLSLGVYKAAILAAHGNLNQAEQVLQTVEDRAHPHLLPDTVTGRIAAVRALLAATRGRAVDIIHYAQVALEKLGANQDSGWRAYLMDLLSVGNMLRGDYQAASQNLIGAIEAGKSGGHLFVVLDALPKLVIMHWLRGLLRQANQLCLDGIEFIEQNNLEQTQAARMLLLMKAFILCERNELDQAEVFLLRGMGRCSMGSNKVAQAWIYLTQIPYLVARKQESDAEAVAVEAEQLGREGEIPLWLACIFTSLLIHTYVRLGKLDEAEQVLHSHHIRADGPFQNPHEGEYTSLVCLLMAKGDLDAAKDLIDRLLEWASAAQNTGWRMLLMTKLALVYRAEGDMPRALETLDIALGLAEPEGFVQTFLLEGEEMACLLRKIARLGIHQDFARQLLTAFPGDPHPVLAGQHAQNERSAIIAPLSARELEVVRLIAAGLSNKEIALKLCVSVRTVKYYTTNIYTKLNVEGRAHAVIKGRELGLFQ